MKHLFKYLIVSLLFSATVSAGVPVLSYGFEDGKLGSWVLLDGSFGRPISDRATEFHSKTPLKKVGRYFLTTLDSKDAKADDTFTGEFRSSFIKLQEPNISFLICGGADIKNAYVALCTEDGKEHFKAAGKNSQELRRVEWDGSALVGKVVYFKVVDRSTASWGHIVCDDFSLAGQVVKSAEKHPKPAKKNKAGTTLAMTASLDAAVRHLMKTYPEYQSTGTTLLAELEAYRAKPVGDARALQLKVLTSHPLLQKNPILFTTRKQFRKDHHNTATLFQPNEINKRSYAPGGSFLKTIDFSKGGVVATIVDPGKTGLVRDPEVSWDGTKIVFSLRKNIGDSYHISECNVDGSGIKELTRAKNVSDIDPVYLPTGDIVFTSTREPKYCMCNRHIMGNLFRMEGDGANIHQIGKSTLFEGHSSILPDGRILYDRWEYVDRNFGDAQGLWVCNPDGTNHAIYWGNNTASPGGVIDGRAIPGTDKVLCIFGSCHDRPWGPLAIIDRKKGVDGRESVVRTWPADAINKVSTKGINKWDSFVRSKIKYEDPYPIDSNFFLVARTTGKGEQTGIYLIDTFGNEVLLHVEGKGCFDPMLLGKRTPPRTIPTRRDYADGTGTFYVQDCSIGTHMAGVKKEDIKYLRVVEAPEKRSWTNQSWGGQGTIAPSMNWHDFSNKRVLGTVPVEDDGSASLQIPSDTFVFFQLLDKDRKMIQSMRSGTIIQSGEVQGCVGCHEDRVKDAPPMRSIKALKRAPSKLNGWYGEPQLFSYTKEVQPVFDKKCIECHDFGKEAGKDLVLAGDRNVFFNASYMELHRKKLITTVGGGPSQIQPAYSWGSHQSTLIKVLEKGHYDVKLSKEEMDRLISWVDLNAPYYPDYDSAYPNNSTGRSPLKAKQLKRLSQLTGAKFIGNHRKNTGPQVSFERPELSPCLQKMDTKSAEYKEALALICAGRDTLKKNPRADMPGFVPGAYARKRIAFYKEREKREALIRKAIREGRKVYDK